MDRSLGPAVYSSLVHKPRCSACCTLTTHCLLPKLAPGLLLCGNCVSLKRDCELPLVRKETTTTMDSMRKRGDMRSDMNVGAISAGNNKR